MARAIRFVFGVSVAMTICSLGWGMFVADHIYHCTDLAPAIFDFVSPGSWVHAWRPIEYVADVQNARTMSDADVIKVGWTLSKLWWLWFAMVGASLGIGCFCAYSEMLFPKGCAGTSRI